VRRILAFKLSGICATAMLAAILVACGGTPESNQRPVATQVITGGLSAIDSTFAANEGRWVLVNVWATWCKPCVAETPELVALDQTMESRNFMLLGLSMDYMVSPTLEEASGKVRAFAVSNAVAYPNIVFTGSMRFSIILTFPVRSRSRSCMIHPARKSSAGWVGCCHPTLNAYARWSVRRRLHGQAQIASRAS